MYTRFTYCTLLGSTSKDVKSVVKVFMCNSSNMFDPILITCIVRGIRVKGSKGAIELRGR